MKTAMQDVLNLVEQMFANAKTIEVETAINDVINIITQEGIEKEKEQIMNAYRFPNTLVDMSSEQYYNQTYNQNK